MHVQLDKSEMKIGKRVIRENNDGFINVTDIWEAAGSPKNKRPVDYSRLPQWKSITVALHQKLVGKSHQFKTSLIWQAKSGPNGGTYSHPVIALAYTEFLSPKLAIEVREVFLRYKSGDATLADEILEKATPEANEWAARRAIGRVVRNQFTQELDKRGVAEGWQYGDVTNQTYTGLFGKTAKQLKLDRGLPKSASLRDKMSLKEIVFVAASEALSIERMEDESASGYDECKIATKKAASALKGAIETDRKDRQKKLGL